MTPERIKISENFEIAAVQKDANLVELEKCCQTHIFLQNFVLIQPRTSPPKKLQNSNKFCQFAADRVQVHAVSAEERLHDGRVARVRRAVERRRVGLVLKGANELFD